jgi:hypothetical protein
MKFLYFFLLLWVIIALLDPDSKYGSTGLIESDPIQMRIRNTEKKIKNYLALCSIKLGEGLEPGGDGCDCLVHQADDHFTVLVLRLKQHGL